MAFLGAPAIAPEAAQRFTNLRRPITFHEREQEGLAEACPSRSITFWCGEQATFDVLTSEEVRRASVLAVLTHGLYDDASELPAHIALAPSSRCPDGLVGHTVLTTYGERFPADVLLLSCGTARGPARVGDDAVAHLGRTFLGLGARSVMLASNEVARGPALKLAATYLESCASGQTTRAQALRLARRSLASETRTRHPFYWAHLQLLGLGLERPAPVAPRSAPAPSGSWLPLAAAVAGIGAIVLGAWWLRRRRSSA
ncbi:MAG: CHAT domain-containing protein [Planctomycetes bacterium]|nr:CHAT domain-containing protein [Planctomycetota bacterium]